MTFLQIKTELARLSSEFTETPFEVRCWNEGEKNDAVKILKDYYKYVDVSDGRKSEDEQMCWYIACDGLKSKVNESMLTEDEENGFDLDVDDDLDLDDLDLDTIDDSSEIDSADEITVLKKKAHDLAEKWFETYKQIGQLARKLDLVATHNDKLEIELKKADGEKADIDGDVDFIDAVDQINLNDKQESENEDSDIDDDFGPSEYDERAKHLPQDAPVGESLEVPKVQVTESAYPWNKDNGTNNLSCGADPNELPLSLEDVDDEM